MTLEQHQEALAEVCLRSAWKRCWRAEEERAKKARADAVADVNACVQRLHDWQYGVLFKQYMGLEVGATYKRLRFSEVLTVAEHRVERAKLLQQLYNDEGTGTGSAT